MTPKDFWHKSTVVVIGGGSWGTVLANLASQNCERVRLYVREESQARSINSTRANPKHPEMRLSSKVLALTDLDRVFEGKVDAVIWALPAAICREQAREYSSRFTGQEVLIHVTKGVEAGSLKRISEVLREEIPCPRLGVLSGPNIAQEISEGQPAATVIASAFDEVLIAGEAIFSSPVFHVYRSRDMVGVEWAGALKNILAIAAGALDACGMGSNARAFLITQGLDELIRFTTALGGKTETMVSLAGIGDILATCTSPLSRNFRVGHQLAEGHTLQEILDDLGHVAEGVWTTQSIHEFARENKILMPIVAGVYDILQRKNTREDILRSLL